MSLDQAAWLARHIPHRVRAAMAMMDMRGTVLDAHAVIEPPSERETQARIYWRCLTDSIWEGRLTAMRWLIEFVGIQMDRKGKPASTVKPSRKGAFPFDVFIDSFDGGVLVDPTSSDGQVLAGFWKACSQASSHATDASGHSPVNEAELKQALTIVVEHLQKTIYQRANRRLRNCVVTLL